MGLYTREIFIFLFFFRQMRTCVIRVYNTRVCILRVYIFSAPFVCSAFLLCVYGGIYSKITHSFVPRRRDRILGKGKYLKI